MRWEPVDIDRVVAMLLVHDIGEIETGDVMVYVEEGRAERKIAERAAVERIVRNVRTGEARRSGGFVGRIRSRRVCRSAIRPRGRPCDAGTAQSQQRPAGAKRYRVMNAWSRGVGPPIREGCPALWTYIEAGTRTRRGAGWSGASA